MESGNSPLFGSAVRGEMRPGSDIDVMVEFDPCARVGLLNAGHVLKEARVIYAA